ncbi:hypothetical protein FB548_1899 [Pseudoxanthomonas sp. 3HH-4]|nr:hypothetical protein [Pseudoxanthomonas sp. 3HH-4]TQM13045.1 hypothetical protein FB548_1899 [Pseudoxanthomonas sp. 3HH-4]
MPLLIATLPVSFARHHVLVRRTMIGRLLDEKPRLSTTQGGIGGTDTM